MKFCPECGNELYLKELRDEGMVPYCQQCESYRFELFNTAVSMVVLSPDKKKTLLIEQYGNKRKILVAGYINRGESAEAAAQRELFEEVGLEVQSMFFQKTVYWEKSNTLLINYIVIVKSIDVNNNWEVDAYSWLPLEQAYQEVAQGGLAEHFYKYFYERFIKGEVLNEV